MNKYIKKLITEQFTISDIDFTDDVDSDYNIFNKNVIDIQQIYNNIIKNEYVAPDIIEQMNQMTAVIKPFNENHLHTIAKYYSRNYKKSSLNWLDISDCVDLSSTFLCTKYNGDISKWDVSNVRNMTGLFCNSKFNNDISGWDVSNVRFMYRMFDGSEFNGNISEWDVSNVVNMSYMFSKSKFNNNISKWDVSNVLNMSMMFIGS